MKNWPPECKSRLSKDAAVAALCAGGGQENISDAAIFEDIYRDHFANIKGFLVHLGVRTASVNDLAQEVFLRGWRTRGQFRGDASIRTWLCAIAFNVARESRRKRSHAELIGDVADKGESALAKHCVREQALELRKAVSMLPPKQREAVTLVYFDGLNPAEAARVTRCDPNVFRQRLWDGRAEIRFLIWRFGQESRIDDIRK